MAYISEVAQIFIQRFYSGWITLRNQLAVPIRVMGRRVIELYDSLISGNDWEVTPYLSLKRRAGHTAYATLNFPAQYMYSWKTNTQGTIPVIDTTGDVGYINSGGTETLIKTKPAGAVGVQSSVLGIGNFLYVGNKAFNFKYDGPMGTQGVTNWGISIGSQTSGGNVGPTLCTSGVNSTYGTTAWTNPTNVTTSGGSYATLAATSSQISKFVVGKGFGFSVPTGAAIIGVQVTVKAFVTGITGFASTVAVLQGSLFYGGSPIGSSKVVFSTHTANTATTYTLGSQSDLWSPTTLTAAIVNDASFGVGFFAAFGGQVPATATFSVNDIICEVFYGGSLVVTPTGAGTFNAVNGYTYVYAYGNSQTGEISNATAFSNNTGPFSSKQYVGVPVVASTDAQVDQIRVYRTTDSGGGNQFFEILNSPFANTSATIQDTTLDTQLSVTSQAEINLGNTPPPTGLTNLEWFAGRMWGSVNNLLYASTGPETLSGTAPNSNWNPIYQFVIPGVIVRNVTGPNGMLVFTQDDCYIVRGTDITNYTINEFIKDFGIRTYNAVDTDGTNLYVFTSDRQFILLSSSGAQDIGLAIGDQLLQIDPTACYVRVNRYGLDSIVRIMNTIPEGTV